MLRKFGASKLRNREPQLIKIQFSSEHRSLYEYHFPLNIKSKNKIIFTESGFLFAVL